MGIRGLYGFINKLQGSSKVVNILDEITKFKENNDKDPVILINLWTMANHLKQDAADVLVGYRLNKIEQKFESFLAKLANGGAELIFTFKKTQTKESDFKSQREEEYNEAIGLMNKIKVSRDFEDLLSEFQNQRSNFEFPYNHSVMLVLCQVANRYGKLYGIDSINSRPSTMQVKLANEHEAIAILGLNTHYIFYSGNWAFWSDADLNMDKMTIRQFNKELILRNLNVTPEKAALFSVLAGSLYSSEVNVKRVVNFFNPRDYKNFFFRVSQFVNSHHFPLSDSSIASIVTRIFGRNDQAIFEDFKRTLKLMDPATCNEIASNVNAKVMRIIRDDYANLAEEILEGFSIYISPVYLDLSTNEVKIHDLLIPLIQKTAGILLRNQPLGKTATVFVKKSCYEGFSEMKVPPIVPPFKVPDLVTLISGDFSHKEKLQMLLWISGLDISIEALESSPDEFVVDAIILAYLVDKKAIMAGEAQCLMKSIVDSKRNEDPCDDYPEKVNDRAFRIGFLYQKLFFTFHSCISAVGLNIFQTIIKFDGADFQQKFADSRLFNRTIDIKVLFSLLVNITMSSNKGKLVFDSPESQATDDFIECLGSMSISGEKDLGKIREEISQLYNDSKHKECLKKLEDALKIDGKCVEFLWQQAECLIMLEKFVEAGKSIEKALRINQADPNVLYVQGLKNYYEGDLKKSVESFNKAIEVYSGFNKAINMLAKAKKLLDFIYKGLEQSKQNNHEEAIKIYSSGINSDPSNKIFDSTMYLNRGMSQEKLGNSTAAFEDYSSAHKTNEKSVKALHYRAKIHFSKHEFEECIIDCEAALIIKTCDDIKKLKDQAKQKQDSAAKRNCFEVLGISQSASTSEIKKAFRKLSLKFHPDKAPADSTEVDKKKYACKFRVIVNACYDANLKRS